MSSVNTNYTDVFSSMGFGNTQQANNTGFSLTDYMSIKSGTYGKLLKAYYKKQDADDAVDETEKKQLTVMKNSADNLRNAALDLMDEDLFEKKKIKVKDEKTGEETEKEDYDWDAITKAVKAFADSYNSVIGSAGESDNTGVLRIGTWLTSLTESNSNLLAKVGITVGSDNTLKVDEDALKKADISTLKLLFQGVNSYADKVVRKASQMASAATQVVNKSGSAYKSNADYDQLSSTGYLYDQTF